MMSYISVRCVLYCNISSVVTTKGDALQTQQSCMTADDVLSHSVHRAGADVLGEHRPGLAFPR
jgi:hypothetical protein